MDYTHLGRSNMLVSKICIGTMHFGPYASQEESFRILDRALELGINFIDTANVYGGEGHKGRSEEIIGSWFAARPGVRDEVVLATKVYNPMGDRGAANDAGGFSAYKVRRQAADSLKRLQTDRIDVYQVHHIDRRVSTEEFWGTFERLIDDGDVLDAGWFGPSDPGTFWEHYRGDWHRLNTARFPTGLRPIADDVHARGMKFGLWCEIEAIGPKAELANSRPGLVATATI